MGQGPTGVHQVPQGHHEQQSRASELVRSQGGLNIDGEVSCDDSEEDVNHDYDLT